MVAATVAQLMEYTCPSCSVHGCLLSRETREPPAPDSRIPPQSDCHFHHLHTRYGSQTRPLVTISRRRVVAERRVVSSWCRPRGSLAGTSSTLCPTCSTSHASQFIHGTTAHEGACARATTARASTRHIRGAGLVAAVLRWGTAGAVRYAVRRSPHGLPPACLAEKGLTWRALLCITRGDRGERRSARCTSWPSFASGCHRYVLLSGHQAISGEGGWWRVAMVASRLTSRDAHAMQMEMAPGWLAGWLGERGSAVGPTRGRPASASCWLAPVHRELVGALGGSGWWVALDAGCDEVVRAMELAMRRGWSPVDLGDVDGWMGGWTTTDMNGWHAMQLVQLTRQQDGVKDTTPRPVTAAQNLSRPRPAHSIVRGRYIGICLQRSEQETSP